MLRKRGSLSVNLLAAMRLWRSWVIGLRIRSTGTVAHARQISRSMGRICGRRVGGTIGPIGAAARKFRGGRQIGRFGSI